MPLLLPTGVEPVCVDGLPLVCLSVCHVDRVYCIGPGDLLAFSNTITERPTTSRIEQQHSWHRW